MHDDDAATPRPPVQGDIVYVREVRPEEMAGLPAPAGARLYAIHDPSGARLALTDDRSLAFRLARRHDRTPVSAH